MRNKTATPFSYNATITCVYPLSDQYALLPRWNYYILLLFALTFQRREWLIHAALGTIITYAGVTSIHAFILLILTLKSPTPIVDLDAIGCVLILGLTNFVIPPLLHFNHVLRASRVQRVVRIWFVLISFGTLCAAISVAVGLRADRGEICTFPFIPYKNSTGGPPADPENWLRAHCNFTCIDDFPFLRKPEELQIFDLRDSTVGGTFGTLLYFAIVAASLTILSIVLIRGNGSLRLSFPCFHLFSGDTSRKVIKVMLLRQSGLQASLVAALPLGIIFAEMVLNIDPSIPQYNSPRSVGQWASWAASGLLIFAALLDWAMQKWNIGDRQDGSENGSDVGSNMVPIREAKKQLPGLRDYKEFKRRVEVV
jgi:hypothetical protein